MSTRTLPTRPARAALRATGVLDRSRPLLDVAGTPAPQAPPGRGLLAGEALTWLEPLRLVGGTARLAGAPRGDGHVVVDIPGWKAPEASGAPIRAFLRRLGYTTHGWGLGTNTGRLERDIARFTDAAVRWAESSGRPVSLVGWSLGGVIARETARRRPDVVRRVVTYGTPVVGGPTFTVAAASYGEDACRQAAELGRRMDSENPVQVPITALVSRRDGIVDWRACIDRVSPRVEHVEVRSTHLGLGLDPDVWRLVADTLARAGG